MNGRILASLIVVLQIAFHVSLFAQETEDDFVQRHDQLGRLLDKVYYDSGKRIDIAFYDLEELERQGEEVPPSVFKQIREADDAMRNRWLELDEQRKELYDHIVTLPPQGDYVLRLECLERPEAAGTWFGLRSVAIVWENGSRCELPLKEFDNAVFKRQYQYHVVPSDAVFVYAKPSSNHTIQTAFEIPKDARGSAELVLSGLDDDPPGASPVRIILNDHIIFEGPNGFAEEEWTEERYQIPAGALQPLKDQGAAAQQVMALSNALAEDISNFKESAQESAVRIERISSPHINDLEWEPVNPAHDWWQNRYICGICWCQFSQDMEHQAKSFRHLGADFLYSYAGHYNPESEFPALLSEVENVGLPYFQFTIDLSSGSDETLRLGSRQELLEYVLGFLSGVREEGNVTIHLAVDEPKFKDDSVDDPGVKKAFREYLEGRQEVFAQAGVSVPPDSEPVLELTSEEDQVAWMEWQLFKAAHHAEHLHWLWNELYNRGIITFIIIQMHQDGAPQLASYAEFGRRFPLISTDIYDNARISESFSMQLLRNAGDGKAVFCSGSGWSDKSPATFRRSLISGMVHAEGLLQWTDVYAHKYRDPKAFWGKEENPKSTDRFAYWHPDYWTIMQDVYGKIGEMNDYLEGTSTGAEVVLLHSERTGIADSHKSARSHYENSLGLYSDLVRRQISVDAMLIDGMRADRLEPYKVAILPDARVLTEGELEALRKWVRAGGHLITNGETSMYDEWGIKRNEFGLADVIGNAARTTAPLQNGFGKGTAHYLPVTDIGKRISTFSGVEGANGLFGRGNTEIIKSIVEMIEDAGVAPAISAETAPDGMEITVRRKGPDHIVHLLDWVDEREVTDLQLNVNLPGRWKVFYPAGKAEPRVFEGPQIIAVRPFESHEALVFRPL